MSDLWEEIRQETPETAERDGQVSDLESLVAQFNAKLLTFDELLHIPSPEPVIDGLLYRDTVAVFYAPSGSAKTFLTLDLAWCVADGRPWQGREVRTGPVLYVLAEGQAGAGQRARAWITAFGGDQPKRFALYPDAVNLLDPSHVAVLAAWAQAYKPVLVVFDTLNKSIPGGDENSAKDVGLAVAAADTIRRAAGGACVVLVHHTGLDGSRERGSTALRGNVNTVIAVRKEGRLVTVGKDDDKQKDAEAGEPISLELVTVDLDDGSSCVLKSFARLQERSAEQRHQDAVLAALRDDFASTGASNKTLREALSLNESQVSRAVNALLKASKISNQGSKTRPHWQAGLGA